MKIDIDDHVHAALADLRKGADETIDDVLRRLMGQTPADVGEAPVPTDGAPGSKCVINGVHFPEGTRLRMRYERKYHHASIKDGKWTDEAGKTYGSPTAASRAIRGGRSGGWRAWDCKRPQDAAWIRIIDLREDLPPPPPRQCVIKGVHFPEGTAFRMYNKGKWHFASVRDGWWTDEARTRHGSPSAAARHIRGNGSNGWDAWDCKRPQDVKWKWIVLLRKDRLHQMALLALRQAPIGAMRPA